MPYIVTTKRPPQPWAPAREKADRIVSRRAVVTLEDDEPVIRDEWGARRLAGSIVYDAREQALDGRDDETYQRLEEECWALPESGGTVGPLPDGTRDRDRADPLARPGAASQH